MGPPVDTIVPSGYLTIIIEADASRASPILQKRCRGSVAGVDDSRNDASADRATGVNANLIITRSSRKLNGRFKSRYWLSAGPLITDVPNVSSRIRSSGDSHLKTRFVLRY